MDVIFPRERRGGLVPASKDWRVRCAQDVREFLKSAGGRAFCERMSRLLAARTCELQQVRDVHDMSLPLESAAKWRAYVEVEQQLQQIISDGKED